MKELSNKKEENKMTKTRFTITIDDNLWHRVGIRAAEMRTTKRAFLEAALRDKLNLWKLWQEIPDALSLIIEDALEPEQIIERDDHYLLAIIRREGDGADMAAYLWRDGYPPQLAVGDVDTISALVKDEIQGWDESVDTASALAKLEQIIS